jgi:Flp pilus assembly protein TadD
MRNCFQGLAIWVLASLACGPVGNAQAPKAPPARTQKLSNPLNDLLDEAQRDLDKNDFEAAIAPLQKVLAEKPDVAYAHFQLAYAYTGLQRAAEARAEYERSVAIDPKMAEAWLNLGILLVDKDPAAAVAPLRKAIELLPAQSQPKYLLGVALDRSGDDAGAAASFAAATRLDNSDFASFIYLGQIALRRNNPAEAEARFRRALEIAPKSAPAREGLAQSLDAQKSPQAAEAYRAYLAVEPDDLAVRARLVHLLVDEKEFDAALAELDKAESGSQPTAESLRLRIDVQIAQNKLDDAIVTLRRGIAQWPGDAQLHGGLGRLYLQKRDFLNAEQELKQALEIDGKNLAYWKDLSSTYYLGGNCVATLAALEVIAKSETPGAGAWFIRALCYDKLNQPQPALDAYQKFLELDQNKNPDQVWQAQQRSKVLRKIAGQKR